jgi:hypothetical protein
MAENSGKRKHTRIGYDMPLSFSLSIVEFTNLKRVEAYGDIVDRSEEGLGFITDFQLEPGHILRLKNENDTFVTARVMWVGEIDGKYRVGVLIYKE